MIKYALIITLIAALVPASTLNVSVWGSTTDQLFVTTAGLETPKEMELKATKQNGETNTVSDFEITVDNVISIVEDGSVRIFAADNDIEFTKARTQDINDKTQEIAISVDGDVSFAGYNPGIYVLEVIVDDERAYESIVVIGEQSEQVVNKEITRINNKVITEIEIKTVFEFPKRKVLDKEKVCLFTPHHPICQPNDDGNCPTNWGRNEDGQCFPHHIKCPSGYWRADDDETGACIKIPKDPIYLVDDPFCVDDPKHIGCPGYYETGQNPNPQGFKEYPLEQCEESGWVVVSGKCYDQDAITDFETPEECQTDPICKAYREQYPPYEEPEPGTVPEDPIGLRECFDGSTPVNGECPKPSDDPTVGYCDALGCPGSPPNEQIIGEEETPEDDEEEVTDEEEEVTDEEEEVTDEEEDSNESDEASESQDQDEEDTSDAASE
jgi:hypothetical protein